jgi:oxygen-independent coproporphyrinogen-3 oxidase
MLPLGLYVHIPFCASICNYCNFNRGLFDEALKVRYVKALVAEISRAAPTEGSTPRLAADTLYFGGGTPSLLGAADVAAIIGACRDAFVLSDDAEVTLEANPETVTVDTLSRFREAGVNRISFGVQSFRNTELRRLSRIHDADRARAAVGEARRAGFANLSLDLMMWLPDQQLAHWLESVDCALALEPDHLSLYMLEVYPNAPLREEMARAAWSQAPDDDVAKMYLTAMERMEGAGYEQYEISNLARPGRRSRHNLKYWEDGDWLGFGCGAHSTCNGIRRRNVSSTDEYVRCLSGGGSPIAEERCLTAEERLGDALFTGLRLSDGVDVMALNRRYGTDIWQRYRMDLQPFVDLGLLEVTGSRWRLTRPGFLLAHEVMAVFV